MSFGRLKLNDLVQSEIVIAEGLANVRKRYLDSEIMDQALFDALLDVDPTPQKKYSDWIFKQFNFKFGGRDGKIDRSRNQDIDMLIDMLDPNFKQFDDGLKKNLIVKKDINQYKTFDDLFATVEELSQKQSKTEQRNEKKYEETEKVYEDDTYIIVSPQSWEASKRWGKGARWCISYQDSDQYWTQYVHENRLKFYFIINKRLDSVQFPQGKVALGIDEYDEVREAYDADDKAIEDAPYLAVLRDTGIPVDELLVWEGWEDAAEVDRENIITSISKRMDAKFDSAKAEGLNFEHTYVEYDSDIYGDESPHHCFYISAGITITIPDEVKVVGELYDISDESDEMIRSIIDEHSTNYNLMDDERDEDDNSITYRFEVDIYSDPIESIELALDDSIELQFNYEEILNVVLSGLSRDKLIETKDYDDYNAIHYEITNADEDDGFRNFKNIKFDTYEDMTLDVIFDKVNIVIDDETYKEYFYNRNYIVEIERGFVKGMMESTGPKEDHYAPEQGMLKGILPPKDTGSTVSNEMLQKVEPIFDNAKFRFSPKMLSKNKILPLTYATKRNDDRSKNIGLTFNFIFKPPQDIKTVVEFLETIDHNYDMFIKNIVDEINEELGTAAVSSNPTKNENFDRMVERYLASPTTDAPPIVMTKKGTKIKRYENFVGKRVGSQIYVHKNYAKEVIPQGDLEQAVDALNREHEGFEYNSIMYNMSTGTIRFDEAPDFDTAREPMVGSFITIQTDGSSKEGRSNMIWHHKWLWVKDDYTGFDVDASREWSAEWASKLNGVAKGNKIGFEQQLEDSAVDVNPPEEL